MLSWLPCLLCPLVMPATEPAETEGDAGHRLAAG